MTRRCEVPCYPSPPPLPCPPPLPDRCPLPPPPAWQVTLKPVDTDGDVGCAGLREGAQALPPSLARLRLHPGIEATRRAAGWAAWEGEEGGEEGSAGAWRLSQKAGLHAGSAVQWEVSHALGLCAALDRPGGLRCGLPGDSGYSLFNMI